VSASSPGLKGPGALISIRYESLKMSSPENFEQVMSQFVTNMLSTFAETMNIEELEASTFKDPTTLKFKRQRTFRLHPKPTTV